MSTEWQKQTKHFHISGFNKWQEIQKGAKPKMAILREQGVNSHLEMAAAFDISRSPKLLILPI